MCFSGIISGFGVVGHNLAAGLFMIFVGIFFALEAIISFAVLVKVLGIDGLVGMFQVFVMPVACNYQIVFLPLGAFSPWF